MSRFTCKDPVVLDLWHAIASADEAVDGAISTTVLLEDPVAFTRSETGDPVVWTYPARTEPELPADPADHLPVLERYGYVWTSFGTPPPDLFPIPEYGEKDRRNIHAATFGVNVSAPRAIENFLDMGHFPYVHTDILGAEPHTEVREYEVEISEERDEIVATNCKFFQPMAAAASSGGTDVDYIYRVPHPYCSVLYKSSPLDESRFDVIAVFVQPVDQEHVRAHMMLTLLDETSEDTAIRLFQQTIFGQDKPILENQYPKRLPLDPRAETPIRADKSAIAYRRWLTKKGITYGVIPAAA
ncbi:aromatic ring-hydroxylating dioxygenase subunit alpha [Nitratireductor sp. XY-223]|uniref:aromatic ring-hydroxylating oxygenase subunit alpha n=1 Tax=Nitratireductor sp. XY-223 TaxID=2561926 RepID=UPI0010A9F197|nr:aromatic ring-hydroxylating dioxygenase subunit alpha [Nitratireductor sp. XY-223]